MMIAQSTKSLKKYDPLANEFTQNKNTSTVTLSNAISGWIDWTGLDWIGLDWVDGLDWIQLRKLLLPLGVLKIFHKYSTNISIIYKLFTNIWSCNEIFR